MGPVTKGGKGRRRKAPLKLVLIFSEVFSKLSCDLVGPLPESYKGNKCMLTTIYVSSRYPEAITIQDIRSEIEALTLVFNRLEYPHELQTNMETSFIRNLTTAFLRKFGVKLVHSSV